MRAMRHHGWHGFWQFVDYSTHGFGFWLGGIFLWIFSSASYRDCLTLGIESGTASMEIAHSDGCPFSEFLLAVFHRFLAKTQKKPKLATRL